MADLPPTDSEQRIQLAIEAFRSKAVSSIRKAAELFDVPRSTLQDRLAGRQTAKASRQGLQRLTVEEEDSIVKAALQLHAWGWPLTLKGLDNLATSLLVKKGDLLPLGRDWHLRFFARHPQLKGLISRPMDQARKDAIDLPTLENWFKLYSNIRQTYSIPDQDVYNMDEKGCMKGIGDRSKVIVPRYCKEAFSTQPGNCDWVSIVECISAHGFVLPPFVIFQGQRIQSSWVNDRVDKSIVIQVSANGWTDQDIGFTWIQHFDKHTATQAIGQYRLLIMDGHSSHASLQFVKYCQDHKIIPLCLPPHSTHELQPLDVGVFGPLATRYRQLISEGSIFGARRIDNLQFLLIYQQARQTIKNNIPGAWRGAGLVPYDPGKIYARHRPVTPPFASLTDRFGRKVDLTVDEDTGKQIDSIVQQLLDVCDTPLKQGVTFIKNTCLTALADRSTLQILNQGLVEKATEGRKRANRKHHGQARVLTVEEIEEKKAEREAKELAEQKAKARRAALQGVIGFAKMVWKEMPVSYEVFE